MLIEAVNSIELLVFNLRDGNVTESDNGDVKLSFRLSPLTRVSDPMSYIFLPKKSICINTTTRKVFISKYFFEKVLCKNYNVSEVLSNFNTKVVEVSKDRWDDNKGKKGSSKRR